MSKKVAIANNSLPSDYNIGLIRPIRRIKKKKTETALQAFAGSDLYATTIGLLNTLGYGSSYLFFTFALEKNHYTR